MIIKFCFENEIHRCSEPPLSFEALPDFLTTMFRSTLPTQFSLFHVNSEGEKIPLASEEDYQKLQEQNPSKPVKVVIVEKEEPVQQGEQPQVKRNPDPSEYEIIRQDSEPEKRVEIPQDKEEEKPLLKAPEENYEGIIEKISEDFTNVHVMPRLEQANPDIITNENVKNVVRQALSEQIPYIISQVKESFIREGLISIPRNNSYGQQARPQYNWNMMGFGNYQAQNAAPQVAGQVGAPDNKNPDFLGKMIKAISELPSKAIDVVDNLAQKIEGDPYVEGKYTKSTIDKVEQLREIFPEEQRKDLLDFVQSVPKSMPIDQIADLYATRRNL